MTNKEIRKITMNKKILTSLLVSGLAISSIASVSAQEGYYTVDCFGPGFSHWTEAAYSWNEARALANTCTRQGGTPEIVW
nr:hypothetical protein [Thalassomonas haliotis]